MITQTLRLWPRQIRVCLLALPLTGLVTLPAATVSPAKPNLLLLLADDLGWSDLGCYGGEIRTPNLDALAQGGLRFTQFYNSARCCPSRASLLTGLYPHQAGVGAMSNDRGPEHPGYRGSLQPDTVTLAEVLRDAGYRTYMVGKWHVGGDRMEVKPTDRGFDEFYGMLGGFNSFWHEQPYYTRWPQDRTPRTYTSPKGGQPGTFYSTDAFADYALDFLADARQAGKPFFLYFAFNAPHFPLHAPEADIAKYEAMYFAKGWDTIREERLARQKQLGLVPKDLALTPRSLVPAKSHAKPSPYAGKDNPAWDSFPEDRRRDLARRMAVFAAMVDRLDVAIGRVVNDLQQHGQFDNTLILFLADNGACFEWDPLGFDGSSSPHNALHTGDDLKRVGGPDSYISYGSGWANAGNTPWRLYKHFSHEGGIRTPLIVHWPAGLRRAAESGTSSPGVSPASAPRTPSPPPGERAGVRGQRSAETGRLVSVAGHIVDIMPTLVAASGASYPAERNGVKIQRMEGRSLLPAFANQPIRRDAPIFFEHEGSRAVRDGRWKLVSLSGSRWELYDLDADPAEMNNLMAREPAKARELIAAWEAWARRCHVDTTTDFLPGENATERRASVSTPQIANHPLRISCEVLAGSRDGVILAQGGRQNGYALHLAGGCPVFSVRIAQQLFTVKAPEPVTGRFTLEARLERDGAMSLSVNGRQVATGKAPGLIPTQPTDDLSIGKDTRTAVGDYTAPHPLQGKVENVKIATE